MLNNWIGDIWASCCWLMSCFWPASAWLNSWPAFCAPWAIAPGAGDPANPNKIFVVNADGTGLREVDSYSTAGDCFCGSMIGLPAAS